jgi:recombination endonuclease VII
VNLIPPLPKTLAKYGLSIQDWVRLAALQDSVCYVCRRLPSSGRLHIDHAHVKNWRKMPPQERRKWVRALACQWCNRSFLAKGMTLDKARQLVSLFSKPFPYG